nr:MAG TPA: hypothetical protein [Caudoviricetes sp.]
MSLQLQFIDLCLFHKMNLTPQKKPTCRSV